MEALLDAETGAEAARLARELAAAWTALGDAEAARRVLEKGYAQAPGDDDVLRRARTPLPRQQDWASLANLQATEAARRERRRRSGRPATSRPRRCGGAAWPT